MTYNDPAGRVALGIQQLEPFASPMEDYVVIARPDSFSTPPNQPLVIPVLANDTGSGLEIVAYSGTNHGNLILHSDGTFTYTPNAGFLGSDGFTYTVRDLSGATADGSVTIEVAQPAGTPIANDDSARTASGAAVSVAVLANDTDPEGEALAIVDFGMGAQGTVEYGAEGRLVYTPGAGFAGSDSFDYRIADATGHTAQASVRVEVERSNRPPEVKDEAVETFVGQPITIPVTANDRDPDGDALRLIAFSVPSHGSVAVTAMGALTYTPVAGYAGTDEFTYDVGDQLGARATARVAITVNRVNVAPTDRPETVSTSANVPVVVDLLANATDTDGDPVRLTAVTMPSRGMLKVASDQKVTYTPQAGFAGADSFGYTVSDGKGGVVGSAVAITVTSVPVAFANGFSYRRRVIVPAAQVPAGATLIDFPLWVDLQGTWLKPAASGGKLQHPSAWDVRFELADGTALAYELDRYDPQAGKLSAWVRVPRLAFNTGVELSLFYGKPGLAASGANPHAVWGDYLAVWHLPRFTDSSANGRNLTLIGTILNASDGLGAGSAGFDGTAAFRIDNVSWLDGLRALTVQVRANADAVGHNHGHLNAGVFGSDANSSLALRYDAEGYDSSGTRNIVFGKLRTSGGAASTASRAGSQTTRWQWLALRWASGDASPVLLLDGEQAGSSYSVSVSGSGTTRITGPLYLGTGPLDAATGGWRGLIDEVRLRAAKLSDAWVLAEHANQSEPLAFYGVGDEDAGADVEPSMVAVPLDARAVAGAWVDLDVVGAAFKPAGAPQPAIVAIEHPAFGTISINGGRIRYAPTGGFLGPDFFTYTLAAGGKRSSSVVSIDVVAPSTDGIPDPLRVVDVATYQELAAAVGNARPGDHIILADGTYTGAKIRIGINASESAPFVIRAKNRLNAVLACDLALSGRRVIVQGVDCSPQDGSLEVGGSYNRVTRCRFNRTGTSVNLVRGDHGRVDHCEFTCPNPVPTAPTTHCIAVEVGTGGTHVDAEIDFNYFHDLPDKVEDDYSARGRSAIRIGESPPQSAFSTRAYVHHNLLLNSGECEISFKARGNKAHFNTVVGGKSQVRVRQGGYNELIGNWLEQTRGIPIGGVSNVVKWNKVLDSPQGITLFAGEVEAGNTSSNGIVQALDTVLVGNTGTLVLGDTFSGRPAQDIPVQDTLVRNHTGDLVRRLHSRTTVLDDAGETPVVAVKLRVDQVGPSAP